MIRRSHYSSTISKFLNSSLETILGDLLANNPNSDLQRNAWIEQIEILKSNLDGFQGRVIFEFAIPRMGKRVDNIIIIGDSVFVIEFKVGENKYRNTDSNQVIDYCLDLKNFHEASHDVRLIPVLVATEGKTDLPIINHDVLDFKDVVRCNSHNLSEAIGIGVTRENLIDSGAWENSIYKPTPTIIEAAQSLYKGHGVQDIKTYGSGRINLTKTTQCLSKIITDSRINQRKTICFITGVPGSGKTLAGLDIAVEEGRKIRLSDESQYAVFLSGNGPLVAVLREALTRDAVLTSKSNGGTVIRKSEAEREVKSFVQNIHHWRDYFLEHQNAIPDKIVVFDEAQRAWSREKASDFMKRKRGKKDFNKSEPQFLTEVMNRHDKWCCVVCLVGGGQEINTGEAGLEEWLKPFSNVFSDWDVHYSNKIVEDDNYLNSDDIKVWLKDFAYSEQDLHLDMSIRSFRSEKLSSYIRSLLDINIQSSLSLFSEVSKNYPIYITRDLTKAKSWLKSKKRGTERVGLIASSGARRLRACGIDVKNEIKAPNWFLNSEDDVRSSFFLEDVATEFDIQGLEIDYACLAWGANFYFANGAWSYQKFKGTKWQNINKEEDRRYLKNTYRVLLTRARQGLVIYIPEASESDETRKSIFYDGTFQYLSTNLGLPIL